jgi:ABC-type nitrate/sulfonate/bicarbonate transport system ATPase subunit
VAATTESPRLATRALGKAYRHNGGRLDALLGLDIAVGASEFVGLIGPSGCGKSTLLNILAGLDEPTEGDILLDGRPLDSTLGRVAYMPQKDLLLPWRTVLDNVTLGLEVAGVPAAVRSGAALGRLEAFGLSEFAHSFPSALSGGMRQRAAFLRTMLLDKPVLLLDEPFSSLDALTRADMQEWLLGVWESARPSVLMVTHDVDEAILLCDRVYVLTPRPGRVALEVVVDLPRPRHYSQITEPEFVRLKRLALAALTQPEQAASSSRGPQLSGGAR